jgi:divalent metal cation (Fe/Co/Zn/Cd) transporter
MASSRKIHPNRQALILAYFTVGYNVLEGSVSIAFALPANSSALLGFGIDSFVESLSGLVMIWRFRGSLSDKQIEGREQIAMQLVGYSLLALAVYVVYESTMQLYEGEKPGRSPIGIGIACASLLVMPILFFLKCRVAKSVSSRSLWADATQSLGCVLLSLALLIGLGLNYLVGCWQADPIAGLVIAVFLAREGYLALTEQKLCDFHDEAE